MKSESLFALIAGAAAGVTIGLLFAPEKGEETREKIKEAAREGYDKAREFGEKAGQACCEARDKVEDELSSIRELLAAEGTSLKESARKIILEKLDKLEEALSREADHDIKADA